MSKKILIIEDNPADAEMVKGLLEHEGFNAFVANNGGEGIKKALEIKPDLVVLDLVLPDMTGFSVCEKLKNEPGLKNTLVVVLSIKADIENITKAFSAKADDYIIKPPVPEFLARKLKLYLGTR